MGSMMNTSCKTKSESNRRVAAFAESKPPCSSALRLFKLYHDDPLVCEQPQTLHSQGGS
jgi:hypothetical protein